MKPPPSSPSLPHRSLSFGTIPPASGAWETWRKNCSIGALMKICVGCFWTPKMIMFQMQLCKIRIQQLSVMYGFLGVGHFRWYLMSVLNFSAEHGPGVDFGRWFPSWKVSRMSHNLGMKVAGWIWMRTCAAPVGFCFDILARRKCSHMILSGAPIIYLFRAK